MKTLRAFFLLAFTAVVLTACTSDKEQLTGNTWSMYELKEKGVAVMSLDPDEQQKVLDREWKKQEPLAVQSGLTRQAFDAEMKEQFKTFSNLSFRFDEKGEVGVTMKFQNDSKTEKMKYTLDESGKKLSISGETAPKMAYTYTFDGDLLRLKHKSDEMVLKRK